MKTIYMYFKGILCQAFGVTWITCKSDKDFEYIPVYYVVSDD